MGLEELEEVGLVLFADSFEVENFAEIGFGFVGDVDEIGLNKGFRWSGPDLKRFEDRVNFG